MNEPTEFNWQRYVEDGHIEPYYGHHNGLSYNDIQNNPYGFSDNPIDDKGFCIKTAKMIAAAYCRSFAPERHT